MLAINTTLKKSNMKQVKAFRGNGKQIDQSVSLMDLIEKALMNPMKTKVNGQNLDSWVITFCIMAMELFLAHPWLCPLPLPLGSQGMH